MLQQEQQISAPKHLLIVDSFALLFRGFFATAHVGNYMRTSTGLCTNGLHQFVRYLFDAVRQFAPTHVVCAFDMGKATFRNELFADYKANRDAPPEELIPQFDHIWELVEAFDIPCVGQIGYEADDMIGSLVQQHAGPDVQISILTGDGDALQLINEYTQVLMMKKGFGNYEVIGLHNLEQLKGIHDPKQIIELKALMGDTADNIPGCPSVGPKTAQKLIAQFGTIDGLYAGIDEVQGKLKERLLEHQEQVYLSRELATIRTDIVVDCSLEHSVFEWDRHKVLAKLEQLELKALARSIAQ